MKEMLEEYPEMVPTCGHEWLPTSRSTTKKGVEDAAPPVAEAEQDCGAEESPSYSALTEHTPAVVMAH